MINTDDLIEIDGQRYLTTAQFAALMNISHMTADNWYHRNLGPDRRKLNGRILYSISTIRQWLVEIEDDQLQITLLDDEKQNARYAGPTPLHRMMVLK